MSYRSLRCPHCGRELQVPEDADKIVCMFCAQPIELNSVPDSSVRLGEAVRLLPPETFSTVIRFDGLNAKNYPGKFASYRDAVRPALLAYLKEEAAYGEEAAELFSDALVDGFEQKEKAIRQTAANAFDLRICITSLTIPAILDLNTPAADRLAELFLKKWNSSHKKPLGKATFSTIQSGFRSKLCFITTAVCTELGKGDDCEELRTLRRFRDEYLLNSPGGTAKISEYYLFAPFIVGAVEASGRSKPEWNRVYRKHLLPCLSALKKDRPRQCEQLYENMMSELEKKWLK
ncbi:CFI-box-CTERM domain-containing protein [Caproicibacter sp.]|uniref:CFI-box-CTERM domain-containing protein n=1 Tax=Caproicibacter sp. TaxID=2814884 RepID=UPI003989FF42